MARHGAGATTRLVRAGAVAGALVVLVVAVVLGAGLLVSRLLTPEELRLAERCTAEVPVPDEPGSLYTASLAPDQTANAALVVGVANRRGLPARAGTIGVATAIQESSLRNIDYGDRDSLGLFQQRPSQGWGSPEQVQDPLYATGAFYDALVEVDGWQDMVVTEAAQAVQRSAFPEAYGQHEPQSRALASAFYGLAEGALWCELRALDGPATDGAPQALLRDLETHAAAGWRVEDPADGTDGTDTTADGTAADAGDDAPRLVLGTDGAADEERTAWAVAHAVVALAARHDVVAVQVDGRVWQRDGGSGWTAATTGSPGVLVTFAG